jgi:hypothetical protein
MLVLFGMQPVLLAAHFHRLRAVDTKTTLCRGLTILVYKSRSDRLRVTRKDHVSGIGLSSSANGLLYLDRRRSRAIQDTGQQDVPRLHSKRKGKEPQGCFHCYTLGNEAKLCRKLQVPSMVLEMRTFEFRYVVLHIAVRLSSQN